MARLRADLSMVLLCMCMCCFVQKMEVMVGVVGWQKSWRMPWLFCDRCACMKNLWGLEWFGISCHWRGYIGLNQKFVS